MSYLLKNSKSLLFILLSLIITSCNNEELYVSQFEEQIIEEEIPEEENPDVQPEIFQIELENDTIVTNENIPVEIRVFENDASIPANFSVSNTTPQNGTLEIVDNGTPKDFSDDTIMYTPNSDYFGTDTFEYTVCDTNSIEENCATARVDITINEVEDVVFDEVRAFPTAYGAGAYSPGGRGGKVIHVTNLNASGTGSLKWALTDESNKVEKKTIVFDVSGVIDLGGNNIVIAGPREGSNTAAGLTIAGQTAPEGGITVTGGKIRMFAVDDVIVRYMKFRETDATDGCLSNTNGNNVIFDHLSGSHTPDIVFALTSSDYTSDNKTLQHCLLSHSKNGFITGDTTPEAPASEYFEQVSILRNVAYKVGWRFPLKGGARIRVDAINNLMHNWDARTIRMDGYAYELNHIGNYYQGSGNEQKFCSYLSSHGDPKIYNSDNYLNPSQTFPSYTTDESVAWNQFQAKDSNGKKIYDVRLPSSYFVNTPNPIRGRAIPILQSSELFAEVLPEAGAFRYIKDDGTVGIYRDTYDTEAINGINNNVSGGRNTSLTNIESLSNTRPVNFYVSNPHIPEIYLDSRMSDLAAAGVSKTDADVHNTVMPSGYTLLEDYLNQVDR